MIWGCWGESYHINYQWLNPCPCSPHSSTPCILTTTHLIFPLSFCVWIDNCKFQFMNLLMLKELFFNKLNVIGEPPTGMTRISYSMTCPEILKMSNVKCQTSFFFILFTHKILIIGRQNIKFLKKLKFIITHFQYS